MCLESFKSSINALKKFCSHKPDYNTRMIEALTKSVAQWKLMEEGMSKPKAYRKLGGKSYDGTFCFLCDEFNVQKSRTWGYHCDGCLDWSDVSKNVDNYNQCMLPSSPFASYCSADPTTCKPVRIYLQKQLLRYRLIRMRAKKGAKK